MKYAKIFSVGSKIKVKSIDENVTVLSATIKSNNQTTYKVAWNKDGDRYSCDVDDVEVTSSLRSSNALTIKSITNKIVGHNSSKVNK